MWILLILKEKQKGKETPLTPNRRNETLHPNALINLSICGVLDLYANIVN
jgi:hypothetical protein